jgi:hypothetical protein
LGIRFLSQASACGRQASYPVPHGSCGWMHTFISSYKFHDGGAKIFTAGNSNITYFEDVTLGQFVG